MAGAAGVEPANAGTKNQCLTTWPRPIVVLVTSVIILDLCEFFQLVGERGWAGASLHYFDFNQR